MNKTTNQKNGGIIFFASKDTEKLQNFYIKEVGCSLWLEQGGCIVLKHGNMLFGFCNRDKIDKDAMITFFYPEKSTVDKMYRKFKDIAKHAPQNNDKYDIYHFYASDPEGRPIEFQYFNSEMKDY